MERDRFGRRLRPAYPAVLALVIAVGGTANAADAADAPAVTPSARARFDVVFSCLAGAATAAERDAAFQLWVDDVLAATPDSRRSPPLAPEARRALGVEVAKTIGRVAATTCTREIAAFGATDPAELVGGLALMLGQLSAASAALPARVQAFGAEIGRHVDPAVLARVTVPGPKPPQPRPAVAGPAADPDGFVPAVLAAGQDLGAMCPYPVVARRLGYTGSVVLELRVNVEGLVEDIAIRERSPHALLDYVAAACIASARFEPPVRDGTPVTSRQRLRWTWRLED